MLIVWRIGVLRRRATAGGHLRTRHIKRRGRASGPLECRRRGRLRMLGRGIRRILMLLRRRLLVCSISDWSGTMTSRLVTNIYIFMGSII